MRRLFIIGIQLLMLTVNLKAQQIQKKYVGPYNFEQNEGTATYTYIEQNGERVLDGTFTFTSSNLKTTVIGKYTTGNKSGLWTKKETFSGYNGIPVVKTDLKWQKVTENIPFKESTDIKIENYVNDKLEGTSSQTTTVKNSWGYPLPGGSSTTMYVIKKNYLENNITNIEASRKEKDKINLSFKGSYKNNFADGNWLFNDNKIVSSYDYKDGYLASYEIKEIGTGKIIESKKIELQNDLINDYFNKSDNSFDVKFGDFNSLRNGKVIIKKVNDNLNVIKLCELKNVSANFINLDLSLFTSAFGITTPYIYNSYDQFAFSPKIDCKTDADYKSVYFNDIKSEYSFLKSATNSKGQFLNIDWTKIDNFYRSPVDYQLKYYLYSGDTTGLKSFLKIFQNSNFEDYIDDRSVSKGQYVNIGNSEKEFYEYLKFLIDLTLGNEESYIRAINENYNKIFGEKKWQNFIINQLDSISTLTSYKYNKEQLILYISKKEKEIESYNNNITQNIKTISIGDQTWMAEDLKVIPTNIEYDFYPQDTITSLLKLYPGFNYNSWGDDIKHERNYYKLKIGNYKYIFVSSKMINETSSPEYFTSVDVLKLCPLGWRLPTEKDFDKLNINLGGDKITTVKMLKIGGGSGFEAAELKYIYFNTTENKPWVFEGFDQDIDYQKKRYGLTPKLYAKCRCIKD